MLSGYKTYLVAIAMVILAGLHSQGYITDSLFTTISAILAGGGLAALRAGINKV